MDNNLIFAAIIVLVAAFIRSVSGFGFSMVAAPMLMFVLEPKSAVVLSVLLACTTNVIVLLHMWRHIDLRRVTFMCLASIPGVPIGAYLLSVMEPAVIKLTVALLVIPFSLLLMLGHSYYFKKDTLGSVIAGFLGGVLISSTSFGGPVVVLFLLNQGLEKERFVGSLAVYFLFITVFSTGIFFSTGLATLELLGKAAILLPTLWLGSYLGIKLLPRINRSLFRRIAPAIVSITAMVLILNYFIKL